MRPIHRGFTLIELMIVVAVVAILAAVAYPSYTRYIQRSHRSAAEAFMLDVAAKQHQRFLDVRSYAADMATLGTATPSDVSPYYTVTTNPVAVAGQPPGFVVTATAQGGQTTDGCGNLTVNNNGTKTHTGSGTNCW